MSEHGVEVCVRDVIAAGAHLRAMERAMAGGRPYPPLPDRDRRMERAWRAVLSGDVWGAMKDLEDLFLPEAVNVLRSLCLWRGLPPDAISEHVRALRENYFVLLADGGREPGPTLLDIAWRTLETAGATPLSTLLNTLPAPAWTAVAGLVGSTAPFARTLRSALPELAGSRARALVLASQVTRHPRCIEAWLDFHLLARVVATAARDRTEGELHRLLRANVARATGRARAAGIRFPPADLSTRLMGLGGLYARTRHAVRQNAFALAWATVAHRRTSDVAFLATRPCSGPEVLPPIDPGDPALRSWALKAALVLGSEPLRAWIRRRDTMGRSTSLTRLLSEIPPRLAGSTGERDYSRVRARLYEELDVLVTQERPALQALAALDPRIRTTPARARAILGRTWSPEVPQIRGAFSRIIPAARCLLDEMRDQAWREEGVQ